jgi:hypothetical protein
MRRASLVPLLVCALVKLTLHEPGVEFLSATCPRTSGVYYGTGGEFSSRFPDPGPATPRARAAAPRAPVPAGPPTR